MRDIIFRGKNLYSDGWSEGLLAYDGESPVIMRDPMNWVDGVEWQSDNFSFVDPETIGQYTGLTDKNSKRIFEGDIIKWRWNNHDHVAAVVFSAPMFTPDGVCRWSMNEDEVIGNIHDNPEPLK